MLLRFVEGKPVVFGYSHDQLGPATGLKVGDEVGVKIVNIDRKNRTLGVSVKAKDMADEELAMRDYQDKEAEVHPTTLGDLIKQQMDQGSSD